MPRRVAALTVLAISTVASLSADQIATFRSQVTSVVIDAIVSDPAGQPVGNLGPEDFIVKVDGKRQPVDRVVLVSHDRNLRPVQTGGVKDVFTNAPPAATARAIAIVIDDLAIDVSNITVTEALLTSIIDHLGPDDRVAVTYITRSDLGQDFTDDRVRLRRAVGNLRTALPGVASPRTLELSLSHVVEAMGVQREPKRAVIVVGHGHKFDERRNYELIQLFRRARQLNVPFYTVDPRGLTAPDLGLMLGMEAQTPEARRGLDQAIRDQQDGNRVWAKNTNGRAFVGASDLNQSVTALFEELSTYYLLTFSPTDDRRDGKFHAVDVTMSRQGLQVRARPGYFSAGPLPARESPSSRLERLQGAAPGGALPVAVLATPIPVASASRVRTLLVIEVGYPPAPVELPATSEQLDMTWLALDPDAKVVASGARSVELPLGGDPGLTVALDELIDLPRSSSVLRVLVRSRREQAEGIVHLPVRHAGDTNGLLPLLVGTAPRPGLKVARLAQDLALPFQPTTRRVFANGETITVATTAVGPSDQPIQAQVTISGGNRQMTIPASVAQTGPDLVTITATVALNLPQGRYELTLTTTGGLSATRSVPIEIK